MAWNELEEEKEEEEGELDVGCRSDPLGSAVRTSVGRVGRFRRNSKGIETGVEQKVRVRGIHSCVDE